MRPFEYARPSTEAEAVAFLNEPEVQSAILAGGTDLMNLLKRDVLQPQRVVDIKRIESLNGIQSVADGVLIGANVTLDEALASGELAQQHALLQVIDNHRAIQIQSMGTLIGDLCQWPACWYFRNGYGLLAMQDGASLIEQGDNRYHAIFGNSGLAKFVSSSRLAPAMIASGAKVRVIGPQPQQEEFIPLEFFFATPKTNEQGVTILKAGQLVTHLWLPTVREDVKTASYEVLEMAGLDRPQAAASVWLRMQSDVVREARIVLGHVAPTPWLAHEAARALVGQKVTDESVTAVADMAVARATPLSMNEHKVQMARAAVKRALLLAVGQLDASLV